MVLRRRLRARARVQVRAAPSAPSCRLSSSRRWEPSSSARCAPNLPSSLFHVLLVCPRSSWLSTLSAGSSCTSLVSFAQGTTWEWSTPPWSLLLRSSASQPSGQKCDWIRRRVCLGRIACSRCAHEAPQRCAVCHTQGAVVSSVLLGAFGGSLAGGSLADRFGAGLAPFPLPPFPASRRRFYHERRLPVKVNKQNPRCRSPGNVHPLRSASDRGDTPLRHRDGIGRHARRCAEHRPEWLVPPHILALRTILIAAPLAKSFRPLHLRNRHRNRLRRRACIHQ